MTTIKLHKKSDIEELAKEINKLASDFRFNIGVQLLNTCWMLEKSLDIEAGKVGQSRALYDILYALIIHHGTMKATDLSKYFHKSKQTITQAIDSLEKDSLVARISSNKDRRVKDIIITEKGMREVKISWPLHLKSFNTLLPELTNEESQLLTDILRKIRRHIKESL